MRYEISEVVKKDQVMELVFGNCSKPRDLLGRHFILQGQVISAYHPDAVKMEVVSEDGEHYPMDTVERQPVFSLFLPHKRPFSYQIHMTFHDGIPSSSYHTYSAFVFTNASALTWSQSTSSAYSPPSVSTKILSGRTKTNISNKPAST